MAESRRERLEQMLAGRGLAAPPAAAARREPGALAAGTLTELVPGGAAAGVTSSALQLAAPALARGAIAWADPLDQWDPDSARRAGLALDRILWLRGSPALRGLPGLSRWNEILGLLVQAGGMALIVADFLDWPLEELRRIPRSAWFRLLRGLEHNRRTAMLLLAPRPLTSTCAAAVLEPAGVKLPPRGVGAHVSGGLRARR